MTAPVDAFDVSISGASPVTVMVSCSWPTSSVMSIVHELLRANADALVLEGLEAGQCGLDRVDARRNRGEVIGAAARSRPRRAWRRWLR